MLGAAQTAQLAGWWNRPFPRTAKTVSVNGSAALSTAAAKYGTASVAVGPSYANLNAAFVAYNATGVSDLQNINQWTNFTAECWVNYTGITTIDDGGFPSTIGCMEMSDYPLNWSLGADRNGALVFAYVTSGGSFYSDIKSSNSLITAGSWRHICVVKQSSGITLYLDGTSVATGTLASTVSEAARPFSIGSYYRVGSNSYTDEIRISKTARYTTGFSPAGPFTNDANTLLLLHCDGTNGSTTIPDDNS